MNTTRLTTLLVTLLITRCVVFTRAASLTASQLSHASDLRNASVQCSRLVTDKWAEFSPASATTSLYFLVVARNHVDDKGVTVVRHHCLYPAPSEAGVKSTSGGSEAAGQMRTFRAVPDTVLFAVTRGDKIKPTEYYLDAKLDSGHRVVPPAQHDASAATFKSNLLTNAQLFKLSDVFEWIELEFFDGVPFNSDSTSGGTSGGTSGSNTAAPRRAGHMRFAVRSGNTLDDWFAFENLLEMSPWNRNNYQTSQEFNYFSIEGAFKKRNFLVNLSYQNCDNDRGLFQVSTLESCTWDGQGLNIVYVYNANNPRPRWSRHAKFAAHFRLVAHIKKQSAKLFLLA